MKGVIKMKNNIFSKSLSGKNSLKKGFVTPKGMYEPGIRCVTCGRIILHREGGRRQCTFCSIVVKY